MKPSPSLHISSSRLGTNKKKLRTPILSNLQDQQENFVQIPSTDRATLKGASNFLHILKSKRISIVAMQAVFSLHFADGRSTNLKDLARMIKCTTAAITNIADRLENLGYGKRLANGSDRRQTLLVLTPKGTELVKLVFETFGMAISDPR